jgi:hypothetical protein
MKLSQSEVELYFELMWPLQFFVNQKLQVLPAVKTLEDYLNQPTEIKLKVRNALYQNDHLIDSFVAENPDNFSSTKLSMVSHWKGFIQGKFYVERFLKKYAILISSTDKVYGVYGLYQGLDEIIHPSSLPQMVQVVLLPFAGKVIYDGLLGGYNISFGSGIRRNLKEIYMIAKQNNRIIETLESSPKTKEPKPQALKSWEPEIQELYATAKRLKGGANYPATHSSALGLVKASLEFALEAVSVDADTDEMYKALKKVARELKKAQTVLDREE